MGRLWAMVGFGLFVVLSSKPWTYLLRSRMRKYRAYHELSLPSRPSNKHSAGHNKRSNINKLLSKEPRSKQELKNQREEQELLPDRLAWLDHEEDNYAASS